MGYSTQKRWVSKGKHICKLCLNTDKKVDLQIIIDAALLDYTFYISDINVNRMILFNTTVHGYSSLYANLCSPDVVIGPSYTQTIHV